jgi:histidine ammonia-lyase
VDSVPTDNNKEDHVSMGVAAALKARDGRGAARDRAALELLTAAQALEFLRPLRPGRGVERAYELVRSRCRPLEHGPRAGPRHPRHRGARAGGAFATIWRN